MIAVFAAFMLQDDPIIKSMGFALAASILFDAFVVRMALIPALMYLLGEKAWWLPAWLDRLLPDVDVEGTSLERDSIPAVLAADDLDDDSTRSGRPPASDRSSKAGSASFVMITSGYQPSREKAANRAAS